jgi:hypothetical protein
MYMRRWLLLSALVAALLGMPAWGQRGGGGHGGGSGGFHGGGGGGFHGGFSGGGFHGGGGFGGHAGFGGGVGHGFGGGFGHGGVGVPHPGFGRPGLGGRPGWGNGWGWGHGWGRGWGWGGGWGWGYPWWGYGYPWYGYSYPYYGDVYDYGDPYYGDSYYGDNSAPTAQAGYGDYYAPVSPDVERQQDEIDRLNDEVARMRARGEKPTTHSTTGINTKTVLVYQDQHTEEVQNYAIVGQTLWVFDEQQARKIPIGNLDLPATKKANEDRGVDFQLPG